MDWNRGPPVLVGEKVLWSGSGCNKSEIVVIKWIGHIPQISSDWCVGVELDKALPGLGSDGFWKDRKLFECRSKHGLLVPMEEIHKFYSKKQFKPVCAKNYSNFKLDDTQIRDFTRSDFRPKENKKTKTPNRYSSLESKQIEEAFDLKRQDLLLNVNKEAQKSISEFLNEASIRPEIVRLQNQDVKLFREKASRSNIQKKLNAVNIVDPELNEAYENLETIGSKSYTKEFIKTMNEVAGYFKEIKEGDERVEKQHNENIVLYDPNESSHSKPKKLFSFLKWFNKKHKNEPNIKLFKDSSAASSPMFPRKETSSCESIDTLFSTQTVRSFAYIPPTQYIPSAPPLDYDKSSYENVFDDFSPKKNASEETESIYDRRKKRKAPEPPRLSRENSLPTTLEHKKNDDENFDQIKTYHRRTVSESFKDKKAGAYCHVQGKRKAPPPPPAPLYPNLQKLNNQHSSLQKKKKPAPPPPGLNFEIQNSISLHQLKKDVHKEKEINQPSDEPKKEKTKDLKVNEKDKKEEKEIKINQTSKDRLTKDVSLSPLPSRPWYKRSHRDSTGSNIIRKDLLKSFDKKKNKEIDDWMPEVGFPRRSLSTESAHSKFNIFSKLEKADDKKKEEKRKSQISILTNISELDREAAEIVRKEQAEEKKLIAANDAKYYLSKELNEKIHDFTEKSTNVEDVLKSNKVPMDHSNLEGESNNQSAFGFRQPQGVLDRITSKEIKINKDQNVKNEQSKNEEEKLKNKENNSDPTSQLNENSQQNSLSLNVLADLTNSTSSSSKSNQSSSQARLTYFNVQNKQLNYLNEPWVCQKCTLENPGWRVFCEICSSVKPKFSFNNFPRKTQTQEEKETVQPDPASLQINKPSLSNQTTELIAQPVGTEANKEVIPVETLDELRKKRMNFFTSKLDSLNTVDKNEPKLPQDDVDKMKLKKILKEMKDSLPKGNSEREENIKEKINSKQEDSKKEHLNKQLEKEDSKEKNASTENAIASADIEETREDRKERQDQHKKSDDLNEKSLVPPNNGANNALKPGQVNRPLSENSPKEIEAYIITKTYVLEDIIVKKPERGRKISASVQTKSSLPATSEAKVIRPPPRTKKNTFEINAEQDKGVEVAEHSENSFQNKIKNYQQEDLEELTTKLTQAEGLADFRANIEAMPLNTEMNTVAVNRLLRKLETAINCGDHFVAGGLAKELALMKINCSVTRQSTSSPSTSKITADLYIEDKVSHQGPIPLKLSPSMSLLQLKEKVQQEFGIPLEVQRWILDKKLATDNNKTLEAEGVKSDNCPLFLYLVVPDNHKADKKPLSKPHENSESKLPEDSQPNELISGPKNKGWYYNYEEDHYSYCEDSEDESNSSDTNLDNETEVIIFKDKSGTISENNFKNVETGQNVKKTEKPFVLNLKSREVENEVGKELKFISVNSVRQKVEKLNKTFAESASAVKPSFRSSRSPEKWKCCVCNVLNQPGKINCLSCNAKKPVIELNNRKNEVPKSEQFKRNITKQAPRLVDDNIHYKALIELQDADLVPNSEPFNCSICMVDYAPKEGVTLKDCLHTFCRSCLVSTVQYSEDAEVKCPYLDETYSCPSVLQQREIKALVPQKIFELHLAKSVKEAENKIENAFHCKTPDCKGWCIYEDNVNEFYCPVCRSTNCLTCQAIHTGINCREYQERMKDASETDIDAKKTREMLNEMVDKGEAMACPKCQVVLMKKWGCDWLRCSMCKTEICWVTRGFRWGPEGKGDTSGGCKCGLNGVKCHPKCNYCH